MAHKSEETKPPKPQAALTEVPTPQLPVDPIFLAVHKNQYSTGSWLTDYQVFTERTQRS